MRLPALLLAAAALGASAPPASSELDVSVDGLRSARGSLLVCLTRNRNYLACDRDPERISRSVSASRAQSIRIAGIDPGVWSLLVVHDENGNGRLDTRLGIPREGFGFSNNPALRIGPPSWSRVAFTLRAGVTPKEIRLKYML